ncbi:FAD-binding protein, partial [Adlercreutzia rubneri]|uniref:FAD-dependent oxidoreductase n=1 Tax=Adlercreutzia rubneri TaxID=2916441 RepID=UPI0023AFFFFF
DATQASNQDLMVALAQKAAEGGATFYYETPCVQLVQEEDGTATGAIGKQKDGSYVKLNATKGVVLAAGDYMNNESMVDRNLRDAATFPLCLVNHTGDGHILGILAG